MPIEDPKERRRYQRERRLRQKAEQVKDAGDKWIETFKYRGFQSEDEAREWLDEMRGSMDEYFSFLDDQLGRAFDKFWLPRRFPLLPPMIFPSIPELEVKLHPPEYCCGGRLRAGWDFCPICGKPLKQKEE